MGRGIVVIRRCLVVVWLLLGSVGAAQAVAVFVCDTNAGSGIECPSGSYVEYTTVTNGYWYAIAQGSPLTLANVRYYAVGSDSGSQQLFVCPTGPASQWGCSGMNWQVFFLTASVGAVTCIPAVRSVAPCPSGYAPATATEEVVTADPYGSAFDGMPVQDMIFAVGMCVCGLLGVGVGVRLV